MKNIILFRHSCCRPSAVLTRHLGNVPNPKFAIGQTVEFEYFCDDPLNLERFMTVSATLGLVVGLQWDEDEWVYYLHFPRPSWFQSAGYEPQPIPERDLKPAGIPTAS